MGWSKSHVADDYSRQDFGAELSPRIFLLVRGSAWLLYFDPVTVVADMLLLGECCLCDLLLPSTPIPINHFERKIDSRAFLFVLSPIVCTSVRFWGLSKVVSVEEGSKRWGKSRGTLKGGRICVLRAFVVISSTVSNTVVIVDGF